MKILSLAIAMASLSTNAAPLELHRPWEGISDPLILVKSFKRQFKHLPLFGEITDKNKLWSGDYWPLKKGNINYRWNSSERIGFKTYSPSKVEAKKMTIPELAALSPSEKYDLFIARYDYPLKGLVSRIASPGARPWEGICHGWAAATLNHDEPVPRLMINPDGIEIPFGSTDIKALLSYYYAHGPETNTHRMGERCYSSGTTCDHDLNAGAFHIVLTNKLGLEGSSFLADIERYEEVWNNPAYRYSARVIKELAPANSSAKGTVKVLRLRTEFYFADNGDNKWQTVIGTPFQVIKKRDYEYDLDIDAQGNIIGGDWRSQNRPDFLWIKTRPVRFIGVLSRLGELLHE